MSDRLKYPVECAGCGIATRKPTIAGNGDKLCPNCLDEYNTFYSPVRDACRRALSGEREVVNGGVK